MQMKPNRIYQAKSRKRKAKDGYVRVEVWTLKKYRDAIREFVRKLHGGC